MFGAGPIRCVRCSGGSSASVETRPGRVTAAPPEPPSKIRPGQADLNEIVAYNFRAARELRGWTQDETPRALEGLLGQRIPQASISAIERAYEGDRRREFDAHEILASPSPSTCP